MSVCAKLAFLCFSCILFNAILTNSEKSWKDKDVRDYSDADVERLLEQWEDNDEDELEPDELPEWKRPEPAVDLTSIDPSDPEGLMKLTKKGKTLMMFVSVSGGPTREETEAITQLWHTSLFNANYESQRFVVDDNRVIFMLKDGSKAWDIKNFLVTQDRCEEVTIEQQIYYGKASPLYKVQQKEKRPDIRGKEEFAKILKEQETDEEPAEEPVEEISKKEKYEKDRLQQKTEVNRLKEQKIEIETKLKELQKQSQKQSSTPEHTDKSPDSIDIENNIERLRDEKIKADEALNEMKEQMKKSKQEQKEFIMNAMDQKQKQAESIRVIKEANAKENEKRQNAKKTEL
ncbi:PREDICTED: LDLR chaperone MESD-like [Priapulus caudatus]|uniref:LDLR chaperone MESD-like n=1 Tax=Priapulus caudatus TaxID=37621 RepID=A0ABM1F8B5_PRICU|nr:PREDICTED: LDLR chaperone MESD-like [Priapulus caudatus]